MGSCSMLWHSLLPVWETEPDRQALQADNPREFPEVPEEQGVQDVVEAPPTEYDPIRQSPLGDVSPVPEQYFPAGHGVQAADVAPPAEYVPS